MGTYAIEINQSSVSKRNGTIRSTPSTGAPATSTSLGKRRRTPLRRAFEKRRRISSVSASAAAASLRLFANIDVCAATAEACTRSSGGSDQTPPRLDAELRAAELAAEVAERNDGRIERGFRNVVNMAHEAAQWIRRASEATSEGGMSLLRVQAAMNARNIGIFAEEAYAAVGTDFEEELMKELKSRRAVSVPTPKTFDEAAPSVREVTCCHVRRRGGPVLRWA